MDATAFHAAADETLTRLMDILDEAIGDRADVDLQDGILTIDLDDGGQYVLNKHEPNRQIWLSSPKSGAGHFAFDETNATWVGTRDGRDLLGVLGAELGVAL